MLQSLRSYQLHVHTGFIYRRSLSIIRVKHNKQCPLSIRSTALICQLLASNNGNVSLVQIQHLQLFSEGTKPTPIPPRAFAGPVLVLDRGCMSLGNANEDLICACYNDRGGYFNHDTQRGRNEPTSKPLETWVHCSYFSLDV